MNTIRLAIPCILLACFLACSKASNTSTLDGSPSSSAAVAAGQPAGPEVPSVRIAQNPDASDAFTLIPTSQLAAKIAGPPAGWASKIVLIDARTRVEYEEGHIPGALNLTPKNVPANLPSKAPDKALELIFYCNGPKCTKSRKAARAAIALGYANVVEYNEGLPAWAQAGLNVEGKPLPAFRSPALTPDALERDQPRNFAPVIVDVRDKDEFEQFRIPGSRNIPLDEIESRIKEIPADDPVVVVDHAGHQAGVTCRLLHSLQRKKVQHLEGGILAWRQSGKNVDLGAR